MTASMPTATMTAEEYFAAPGLSNSAMKDLAISPYRYWFRHLSPDRPINEPTPEMQLGSALHCAVLEPEKFDSRYACKVDTADCLMTADDIKEWLSGRRLPTSGKLKQDLIDRAVAADPDVRIFELVRERHEAEHIGKTQFKQADWQRIQGMAEALRDEPAVQRILSEGQAEVPMCATDPETGVLLKARMDWVAPNLILDLKTFSQQRGKSIDKSIADALHYEGYHRQCWFYNYVRCLRDGRSILGSVDENVVLVFVESDEPHEVRIKRLTAGHLYWDMARLEVQGLIRLYADCVRQFGGKPWREKQDIDPLVDEDIKQLAY